MSGAGRLWGEGVGGGVGNGVWAESYWGASGGVEVWASGWEVAGIWMEGYWGVSGVSGGG